MKNRKPGAWVESLRDWHPPVSPTRAPRDLCDSTFVMSVVPASGRLIQIPDRGFNALIGDFFGCAHLSWRSDASGFTVNLNGRYLAYHLMTRTAFLQLLAGIGLNAKVEAASTGEC